MTEASLLREINNNELQRKLLTPNQVSQFLQKCDEAAKRSKDTGSDCQVIIVYKNGLPRFINLCSGEEFKP